MHIFPELCCVARYCVVVLGRHAVSRPGLIGMIFYVFDRSTFPLSLAWFSQLLVELTNSITAMV
jgi:hypothetical protein